MKKTVLASVGVREAAFACLIAVSVPVAAQVEATNLMHIGHGGIAIAHASEATQNWRTYAINLVEGTNLYGWTSAPEVTLPHALEFELQRPSVLSRIVLDSSVVTVTGYDGKQSELPAGGPLRRFRLSGAEGDGAYAVIVEGELDRSAREAFTLTAPATVQRLRLEVLSNWGDLPQTHLSEIEAIGVPVGDAPAPPAPEVVDGLYAHEYGPIVLRRNGHEISGCYLNGAGRLAGLIEGRVIRLAYLEPAAHRNGSVVFAVAQNRLFGFWYGPLGTMGSPWNAPKVHGLDGDLGGCAYLAPGAAQH